MLSYVSLFEQANDSSFQLFHYLIIFLIEFFYFTKFISYKISYSILHVEAQTYWRVQK